MRNRFINYLLYIIGPNYVRPDQSFLCSNRQQKMHFEHEFNMFMTKIVCYLVEHCRVPRSSSIIQQFSNRVKHFLERCYSTSLELNDEVRARKELALVKSIRHKLNKAKLILRRTDKSNVFHVGQARDYEEKAKAYRNKTGAFQELVGNPLSEIYNKVKQLLDDFLSKKHISARQPKKMMPDRKKIKLAHMYFLPKAHKVNHLFFILSGM